MAEDQLRQRVVDRVQPVDGPVSAQISSFPFLGRLLASGEISQVDVAVRDLTVRGVTFASVGVRLRSVQIDRDSLLEDRRVALASIGHGTAVVEIAGDEISRLLGVTVVLEDGAGPGAGGRDPGAGVGPDRGEHAGGGGGRAQPARHRDPARCPSSPA